MKNALDEIFLLSRSTKKIINIINIFVLIFYLLNIVNFFNILYFGFFVKGTMMYQITILKRTNKTRQIVIKMIAI